MGELVCRTCGVRLEKQGRGYKYCEVHRLSRAKAKARDQRNLRARRKLAPTTVKCQGCGASVAAQRSDAKWCDQCAALQAKVNAQRYEQRRRHRCPSCGTEIARTAKLCRACANKARGENHRGEKNSQWKGGRRYDNYGYVHIRVQPSGRTMEVYRPEHRLVWEAAHGTIPENYVIHHINGIKDDNRLENLEALPRKQHNHRHDDHDRRIRELEAEVAKLREQLNGNRDISPSFQTRPE